MYSSGWDGMSEVQDSSELLSWANSLVSFFWCFFFVCDSLSQSYSMFNRISQVDSTFTSCCSAFGVLFSDGVTSYPRWRHRPKVQCHASQQRDAGLVDHAPIHVLNSLSGLRIPRMLLLFSPFSPHVTSLFIFSWKTRRGFYHRMRNTATDSLLVFGRSAAHGFGRIWTRQLPRTEAVNRCLRPRVVNQRHTMVFVSFKMQYSRFYIFCGSSLLLILPGHY